jgi:hypothetical protein
MWLLTEHMFGELPVHREPGACIFMVSARAPTDNQLQKAYIGTVDWFSRADRSVNYMHATGLFIGRL